MENCRNTLSAICLFQIFGGIISNPVGLGISQETLRKLMDQNRLIQIGKNGYQLNPSSSKQLPFPYDLINKPLPFKGTPYLFENSSIGLGNLLSRYRFEKVIELGSESGMSTIFIATFLPQNGKVLAVSRWEEYEQVLSNIIRTGLVDAIIPVNINPLNAYPNLLPKAEMVYIHAPQKSEDLSKILEIWENQKIKLCGNQHDKNALNTLKQFTQKTGKTLNCHGQFWEIL